MLLDTVARATPSAVADAREPAEGSLQELLPTQCRACAVELQTEDPDKQGC